MTALGGVGTVCTINIELNVSNAEALWQAAARRALSSAIGLTPADVEDTIGPREAPSIADCIAMLIPPSDLAGCTITHLNLAVEPAPAHQVASDRVLAGTI
ncbi:hypothetical protein [uncultured Sphingomonas sp.]|uniref:hypothetical protein n=1 Tax=uncultured Sphingomonas sp. TaxID=158754 RepID=UPI002619D99E|nr:hypothetical protein [uncultured Sphingomonas sp.]